MRAEKGAQSGQYHATAEPILRCDTVGVGRGSQKQNLEGRDEGLKVDNIKLQRSLSRDVTQPKLAGVSRRGYQRLNKLHKSSGLNLL
ncbi:hypothetical protein L3X38_043886 [Prunus dulcis]|uniref:Uncharacterized protein n=1 Tax=Prunus dulcis TaxID=3755 RepID=A0AAD4YMN5_PRUDU|nr:hypothetical protein L3X38_043886 [Prunus dulcis]